MTKRIWRRLSSMGAVVSMTIASAGCAIPGWKPGVSQVTPPARAANVAGKPAAEKTDRFVKTY
jgi:hypothetical protein